MDVGDRVMVRAGKHGGMIGTLTKIRDKTVRYGKQPCLIEKPVGTVVFDKTHRTIDEVISNLRGVPIYPFA